MMDLEAVINAFSPSKGYPMGTGVKGGAFDIGADEIGGQVNLGDPFLCYFATVEREEGFHPVVNGIKAGGPAGKGANFQTTVGDLAVMLPAVEHEGNIAGLEPVAVELGPLAVEVPVEAMLFKDGDTIKFRFLDLLFHHVKQAEEIPGGQIPIDPKRNLQKIQATGNPQYWRVRGYWQLTC